MKNINLLYSFFILLFISGFISAQNPGNNLFDDSYVHEIRVTFYTENFWDTLESNYAKLLADESGKTKIYIPAKVEIDGTILDTIGFREKGVKSNYASSTTKKPFKIDINEFVKGQKYDGLKKINLQNGYADASMMHDKLSYNILRKSGLKAPRSAYTKLYFNNTYWGLYLIVEQIDKIFLKQNFSNGKGNLYKCINNFSLKWLGNDHSKYAKFLYKRTNKKENKWGDLIYFTKVINNVPISQIEDSVNTYFEINDFIKSMAIDITLCNWDSYFDNGRNYYLYNNPENNKFSWIHWDYNTGFSSVKLALFPQHSSTIAEKKPLEDCIYYNPNYRIKYLQTYSKLFANNFTSVRINALIDRYAGLIHQYIATETNSVFTIDDFNAELNNLKTFVSSRISTLTQEVNAMLEEEKKKNLLINEIILSNKTILTDENGEYESWIELYNPTNSTISLKNYFITNDSKLPKRWNLPNKTIASGEYTIVWADSEMTEGAMHANFEFGTNSKRLQLLQQKNDTLILVNSILLPTPEDDKSFGRKKENPLEWIKFDNPTPNQGNNRTTSIVNVNQLPKSFQLHQNYPNPFNPTTTIEYSVPNVEQLANFPNKNVTLKVYNVLGKEVTTLKNKQQIPGNYKVQFDASNLPSGVYFYIITIGDISKIKQMVLIK